MLEALLAQVAAALVLQATTRNWKFALAMTAVVIIQVLWFISQLDWFMYSFILTP